MLLQDNRGYWQKKRPHSSNGGWLGEAPDFHPGNWGLGPACSVLLHCWLVVFSPESWWLELVLLGKNYQVKKSLQITHHISPNTED